MSRRTRILFVASREPSYPRVAMTLEALQANYDVDAILCHHKSYVVRLLTVAYRFVVVRKSRYDVVFVAFFAQPIMPLVRALWRGPIVLDAFISLFDSLVLDKGLTSRDGLVARYALWLDRLSLRSAQVALVDTLEHEQLFKDIAGVKRLPTFQRHWASAQQDIFPPLAELPYDPQSGAVFEVLFWGGFIPLQGVDIIVEAAARLDAKRVRITIVGTGQTFAHCRTLAASLNVQNIDFVGWKTPAELTQLAERSHLLLGIFGKTEKAKRVIPNKAFQALALKKPLLTGRSVGIAELLTEGRDVLLCEMADPDSLATSIEAIRLDYRAACEVGRNGYSTFVEHCSSERRALDLAVAVSTAQGARREE